MTTSAPLVGAVNAGSSSLKFAIYEQETRIVAGLVDGIGLHPGIRATDAGGQALPVPDITAAAVSNPAEALRWLLPWLNEQVGGQALAAVGHRVLHGGPRHSRPERVTPALMEELVALESLAPLHQPYNLAPIRAALEQAPDLPQVACFDTAFHCTVPEVAQAFAIPATLANRGIRRYGFHGLSYEYIASALPSVAPGIAAGRVIVAHLGNGASLCALRERQSVATTMGFSALDGLPMGTRCGELDPAVVLFLIEHDRMSPSEVQDLLYKHSGMLGLSGISSDFRDLLASPDPRARFAVEVFVYRIARSIGSLAAALGGLDAVVFTAGIGENAAAIRAAVCEACAWLGVELDRDANLSHGPRITREGARVAAYVIPTDEDLMIARHARAVIAEKR